MQSNSFSMPQLCFSSTNDSLPPLQPQPVIFKHQWPWPKGYGENAFALKCHVQKPQVCEAPNRCPCSRTTKPSKTVRRRRVRLPSAPVRRASPPRPPRCPRATRVVVGPQSGEATKADRVPPYQGNNRDLWGYSLFIACFVMLGQRVTSKILARGEGCSKTLLSIFFPECEL